MENIISKWIAGIAALGLIFSGTAINPQPTIQSEPQIIKDELDIWIDGLVEYESCPREGIVDTNRKLSFGCLCFQSQTFEGFVKEFNLLPEAEDHEIINMIDDCDFQKVVAKKMIESKHSNWSHWRTSVDKRKFGLPPK